MRKFWMGGSFESQSEREAHEGLEEREWEN
jgi:hypothetical protein